ncbi:MAG: alginate export family protein [Candidatus Brocadiaceae bacterium]|nr:alginate export family protein [Candidatus Brocadiaceae bacterium]
MKNGLWRTCIGGFATAVFCVAACAQSFGAGAKTIEEMEKELNALKASVSSLTKQMESVKSEKAVASVSSDTKEDVEALKNEVTTLKEEMRTAAQAETLKAADITGNVYSEFAKKVKLGGQIRTRAEYANGWYNPVDFSLRTATTSTLSTTGTPSLTVTGTTLGFPLVGGATTSTLSTTGVASNTRRSAGRDDDYVLNQTRLWADADVNEHLRVFIQFQDSRVFGSEGSTIGFADDSANNRIDIHQGYFDIKKLFDLPLTVRVGRQEIIWGDHRVIGNFVWSNVGRVFDGGRFMWDTDAIHAEAFAVKTDEDGFTTSDFPGVDSSGGSDEAVYAGMFAFKKLVPGALLELMYIQKNDQDQTAAIGPALAAATASGGQVRGNTIIHDIGARIDGKVPGLEALDYTLEGHGQFGDIGDLDKEAWAFAGRTGYTIKNVAWTPRIGFEYTFASGDDDPTDGDDETFDNLYPTNHWQGNYGFIDVVGWRNMHGIRGNIKVNPTKKLMVQVDYWKFLLAEEEDAWYFANGNRAFAGAVANNEDDLGQEVDLTVSYSLYKNVGILAGYSVFLPGDYIEDSLGARDDFDTHWGYLQTTVTF